MSAWQCVGTPEEGCPQVKVKNRLITSRDRNRTFKQLRCSRLLIRDESNDLQQASTKAQTLYKLRPEGKQTEYSAHYLRHYRDPSSSEET